MRIGKNIRLRKDGRYEARYMKGRGPNGKILYGYCYGRTYEEAESKRDAVLNKTEIARELNLLILGAGSHGREVMELAQSLRIFRRIDFLDDIHPERAIGPCKHFEQYLNEYPAAIPAIGDTEVRKKWMMELIRAGFVIPTLVHPSAIVSGNAEVGIGTVICARATIATDACIGRGCIISGGAIVDKGVVLDDWSYIDCGETISGQGVKRRHMKFV